jgi:hypothetical protein
MNQPLLNHQQCQQSMAITLQEDLWSIQRVSGELNLSEKDYKDLRCLLVKAIGILGRYS